MRLRGDTVRILKYSVIALGILLGLSLILLIALLYRTPAQVDPSQQIPAYTRQPDPAAVSLPNPSHDNLLKPLPSGVVEERPLRDEVTFDAGLYRAPLWGIRSINLPEGAELDKEDPHRILLPNGARLSWQFYAVLQDIPLYEAEDLDPVVSSLVEPAELQPVETVEGELDHNSFRVYRAKATGGKQIYGSDAPNGGVYLFLAEPASGQTPEELDQQIRRILSSLQKTNRVLGAQLIQDQTVGIEFFAEPKWSLKQTRLNHTVYEHSFYPVRWLMKRMDRQTNPPEVLGILHDFIQSQAENSQVKNLVSTEPKSKKYNGHDFYETEIVFRNPTGDGPRYSMLTTFAEGDWTYQMMLFGAGDESLESSRNQIELFQKTVRIR